MQLRHAYFYVLLWESDKSFYAYNLGQNQYSVGILWSLTLNNLFDSENSSLLKYLGK